jgi:hypothetical protein
MLDATCTEEGYIREVCDCGYIRNEVTLGAAGHSYEQGICYICGYSLFPITGECGESLTWVLTVDGTLTVSGNGAMPAYSYNNNASWYEYDVEIKAVVLEEGVTSVGSYAFYQDKRVFVPSFLLGGTIETTGAGDTFCASVLNFILEHGLDNLSRDDLREMLRFANAAAYLVTTKKGAIRSMPERAEVERICTENP